MTAVSCVIFIMFFGLSSSYMYILYGPRHAKKKVFSGMVDLVCFKPAWSATKAS